MKIIPVTHIPFTIDSRKIIKAHRPVKGHSQTQLLEKIINKASSIARPGALISLAHVLGITAERVILEQSSFTSHRLAQLVKGHTMLAPFVATAGPELEEWSENEKDLLVQYWTNEIQNQILKCTLNHSIKKLQEETGWHDISLISPGSIQDWAPEEQSLIVALFREYADTIGIKINNYHVMYPPFSLSGIFFRCPESEGFCSFCQNNNCPQRTAPPHELLKKQLQTYDSETF